MTERTTLCRRDVIRFAGTTPLFGVTRVASSASGDEDEHGGNHQNSSTENSSTEGDGHEDSAGLGPAVKHATVTLKTSGGVVDVLTGTMSPRELVQKNRNHFEPHMVHVRKGGTVKWRNKSGRHAVVAYHPANHGKPKRIPNAASPWNSGGMSAGDSFTQTFEVEGVYDYYCPPHESRGMIGSIVVGTPSLGEQPGLRPPQDSLPSAAQTKLRDLNEQVRTGLSTEGGQ